MPKFSRARNWTKGHGQPRNVEERRAHDPNISSELERGKLFRRLQITADTACAPLLCATSRVPCRPGGLPRCHCSSSGNPRRRRPACRPATSWASRESVSHLQTGRTVCLPGAIELTKWPSRLLCRRRGVPEVGGFGVSR